MSRPVKKQGTKTRYAKVLLENQTLRKRLRELEESVAEAASDMHRATEQRSAIYELLHDIERFKGRMMKGGRP